MKWRFVTVLYVCMCALAAESKAQGDTIITMAGNGMIGYTGDGGPAMAAEIYPHSNVIFDKNDNYYFTQYVEHKIRKVSASGLITCIAGTGMAGYTGDGGAATLATLNGPIGMAIDDSDNLYIADSYNNAIRKINLSTGIITTCAGNGLAAENGDGGLATAASVYSPRDVCLDRNRNLYISDADNRIRKVDAATGIITTVAGRGGLVGFSGDGGPADSARLYGPQGICTDTMGNLFIADYYNDRIRKVDAATGIISTIAGDSLGTYNGEGIPATTAQLNPFRIMFDRNGNLFITDSHNWRFRKIDTAGIIHTVAGNGINGYNGDCGPATAAELCAPAGLGFDSSGHLYINDGGCDMRIRKLIQGSCLSLQAPIVRSLSDVWLYPNPATMLLTISSSSSITSIAIINLVGQTVLHQVCHANTVEVRLEGLPAGVYSVSVTDDKHNKVVRKMVKQ